MRPSTGYPRSGLNPSRVAICVEIAQLDATKTPSAAATAAGFTNRCATIVDYLTNDGWASRRNA
jgi:hypothetical protein